MEIKYNIGLVDGKYISESYGDGIYYNLMEMTYDNLNNFAPTFYNENSMSELSFHKNKMIDESSGKEFSGRDIIFQEISINI